MIRKKMSRKTNQLACCLFLCGLGLTVLSNKTNAAETDTTANADMDLKLPYRIAEKINDENFKDAKYDINPEASSKDIHFFGQDLEDNYNKYLMIPDFQFGNINYKGQAVTVPAQKLKYVLNDGTEKEGLYSEIVTQFFHEQNFYVSASPFTNENNKTLKGASINIDYNSYDIIENTEGTNVKLNTLTTTEESIEFITYPPTTPPEPIDDVNTKFELNVQDLHVNLNIPANLSIDDNTTYTSTLTWITEANPIPPTEIQYDGYWGTAPYTFDKDTGELIVYSGKLAPVSDSSENGYIGNQIGKSLVKSVRFVGKVVAPTNSSKLFFRCTEMETFDGTNLDTSKVTDMDDMFRGCTSLTSIDVSNWDTSKVINMYEMFYYCSSLTNIDVSNWDTSKVTSMQVMFEGCSSLTSLDVSKWDTSNVTEMSSMFKNTTKLDKLTLGETFKFTDDTSLLGTWKLENGDKTFTGGSQWLNYNGATDAGTYIKQ